ncbi:MULTISPECIES: sensor histidine kinase [unclassified Frondihabitans]|uniref:sensor histidine kinase n=1 Tax=unclassified Frondihabitans TaxID=2626248 RepID=UPI0006F90C55|nr:histidine kinase [Frondihabitans sp. Leaf304]KQQ28901.1 hypothetical protein ASF54_09855 [Frondihabitans sp. Leaf304]
MSTAPLDVDPLLPRPPGLVRRFWMRHARLADWLLAVFALIVGYLEAVDTGAGLVGADWLVSGFFALPVVGAAALLWRRSRPLTCFGVALACSLGLTLANTTVPATVLVLALYAVAVYDRVAFAWIGAALAVALNAGVEILVQGSPHSLALLTVTFAITLLIGVTVGGRRRYLEALLDRAAQLTRERDQQGQLAAIEERARIAREMHDVVAHGLSVMIRLSDGAAAVATSDPERSREAVRQIGEVGRSSLRDMRRLLGVLRDEGQVEFAPQPTLAELDDLVETYRSAGLPVAVQQKGTPPTDTAIQVALFRGVQEALTNALRYSREPGRVLVSLDYDNTCATLDVTDDGIFVGRPESVGSGRGLLGLRERAVAFGGTVEAGPAINPETGQDGGGWRVRMMLPTAIEGTK